VNKNSVYLKIDVKVFTVSFDPLNSSLLNKMKYYYYFFESY